MRKQKRNEEEDNNNGILDPGVKISGYTSHDQNDAEYYRQEKFKLLCIRSSESTFL